MGGDGVEGPRLVPIQKLLHGAFPRVVSRQGQRPILELPVQVSEVFGRGARVIFGAQPLIRQPRPQPVLLGGGRHQLIQARRAGRTARPRIKRRFHFREPHQFRRNLLLGEDRFQPGHEGLGRFRPRSVRESLDPHLPFLFRRRVGNWPRRLVRLGLGRVRAEPVLLRGLKIIQSRSQPRGVGLRLFVAVEHRQQGLGGVFQGGKVNHVLPMKLLLEIGKKPLHLLAIHLLQ